MYILYTGSQDIGFPVINRKIITKLGLIDNNRL